MTNYILKCHCGCLTLTASLRRDEPAPTAKIVNLIGTQEELFSGIGFGLDLAQREDEPLVERGLVPASSFPRQAEAALREHLALEVLQAVSHPVLDVPVESASSQGTLVVAADHLANELSMLRALHKSN